MQRKLNRDDCVKKGYILEGFPETVIDAKIMEDMSLTPNRIFLVSISEAESQRRMAVKREAINSRRLPGFSVITVPTSSSLRSSSSSSEYKNMAINPHSEHAVKQRFDKFTDSFDDLMTFFGTASNFLFKTFLILTKSHHFLYSKGSRMVYIDGGQPIDVVKEFTEASVIRPPTLQF